MSEKPSVQDLLLEQLAEPPKASPAPLVLVPRITKVKPAMNLPLLTLFLFPDAGYATALCEAINKDEKRLYVEDFEAPVVDAVEAMVGVHQFDSIRLKSDWTTPLWQGGFTPADIFAEMRDLGMKDLLAHLLINRIREVSHFASYRFIVRDAFEVDLSPIFKAFPAEEILIVQNTLNSQVVYPTGTKWVPIPFDLDSDPDGKKGADMLAKEVGAL